MDLPLDSSDAWDGGAAAGRMLDAAGIGGDNPDVAKAQRGFLAHDAANATERGSYKLPFADIVGGELKAIAGGIRAAASRLPQNDIPQNCKDSARRVLDHYGATEKPKAMKFWQVAWLTDILMDLDLLKDFDGGTTLEPARLVETLKALGAILSDLTEAGIAELLGNQTDEMDVAPATLSLSKSRLMVLRLIKDASLQQVAAALATLAPDKPQSLVDILANHAKAGRVLSTENEKALRTACDHMNSAMNYINGVVGQVSEPADPEKSAADARARRARVIALEVGAKRRI
jgi:hypothetical protein